MRGSNPYRTAIRCGAGNSIKVLREKPAFAKFLIRAAHELQLPPVPLMWR